MCQLREDLARIFFPANCSCMNFFWHDGLVQEFFSYAYALAGYFFSKSPIPPPPPPPQKLNGRPLTNGRSSADALMIEPEICETNLIVFLKGGACCPK